MKYIFQMVQLSHSNCGRASYPNLLRGLQIVGPDQIWCGDITAIPLVSGSCLYLPILMDTFTRMIHSWFLRRNYSETLVQETLDESLGLGFSA